MDPVTLTTVQNPNGTYSITADNTEVTGAYGEELILTNNTGYDNLPIALHDACGLLTQDFDPNHITALNDGATWSPGPVCNREVGTAKIIFVPVELPADAKPSDPKIVFVGSIIERKMITMVPMDYLPIDPMEELIMPVRSLLFRSTKDVTIRFDGDAPFGDEYRQFRLVAGKSRSLPITGKPGEYGCTIATRKRSTKALIRIPQER